MPVWLTIVLALGGSALISTVVGFIFNTIVNRTKQYHSMIKELQEAQDKQNELIRRGVQALLRNDLYKLHEKCMNKGYATIDEKNNFENLYLQYHGLGKNGVMDSLYGSFMKLPLQRKENN